MVRAVVGVGAVLRLLAVVGITPTVYVDSGEYRGVALLGGERRPWTVPLVHALVGDSTARVVFHAVLGAAAWGALALVVASLVRDRRVQVGAAAVVMLLALVAPVTNYDTTITSETVAISLTVGLLAAWLAFVNAPTPGRAAAVLAVTVFFAFTRNDHPWLVAVLAAVALAISVGRRGGDRTWRLLAVGLVVVSAWSLYAVNRNDEIARFNLALVVANRILPDAGATDFFTDRGMPLPPPEADVVLALAGDPAWNAWAADDGRSTYLRWLASNPDPLLLGPWPDLFGTRSTTLVAPQASVVLLAPGDRYGRVHPVVPEPVEAVVWGGTSAAPVVLGGAALAVVAVRRRDGLPARVGPARAVAAGALVLAFGHLLVVWHASPNELGRLAMVPATLVHVALVVLGAVTVDRALARRSG
jgi:hypothetical protein